MDTPARVIAITGPAGSGKTEHLLGRYREALRAAPLGATLWLSPNQRSAAEIRERLPTAEMPACFRPAVMTFAGFAQTVLAASDAVVRPISELVKRQLVRQLIDQAAAAGRLDYFEPIVGTGGLIDLVSELISELKRYEIWPDDFARACQARGWHDKDRDLLSIYRDYQDYLTAHELYDAEGRLWTARALLRDGQTRAFPRLNLIVVDGFTDFTRTQHEIVQILAARGAELLVSLPLEAGAERRDLFAKPRQTLERLRELHPQLEERPLRRGGAGAWPARDHVERYLFASPHATRPAADTAGLEVIEAARVIDELQTVGRRIKELLLDGDPRDGRPVRPGQVLLVFRSLHPVAAAVRQVFGELGLPLAIETNPPLAEAPAMSAQVALLRLHVEDWPYRGLLGLLSSNYFAPDWPEYQQGAAARIADRVLRELQVTTGADELLRALGDAARGSRPPLDAGRAQAAQALLARLQRTLARLPARATTGEWGRALAGLAAETGLRSASAAGPPAIAAADKAAWERLMQALEVTERSLTPPGAAPARLTAQDLIDLLVDVLRSETLPREAGDVGRVRVVSATSARAVTVDYLFFAGLSETAFPPPDRVDRLYSEAEYQRLAAAGLPLVLRAEHSQEEMLLFYEVVTRPRRALVLSYPGLDDKGQPLLPSPYLLDLEQACGVDRIARSRVTDMSPIPSGARPFSLVDARVLAVHQALHDEAHASLLAGLLARQPTPAFAENICDGLALTAERARGQGFGPYEGIVRGGEALAWLQQHFGPDYLWSASSLEQYAACPHQFFLEKVLGLAPLPDLALELDFLGRGTQLHAALARLHAELNAEHGRPTSPAAPAASDAARRIVERLKSEAAGRDAPAGSLAGALAEIDGRLLAQWLDAYLAQHAEYDRLASLLAVPPAPAHFEVSFGIPDRGDDPLSTAEPLVVSDGEHQVLIRGRIDRIDLGRHGDREVFSVLDYKTGSARRRTKAAILAGDDLQLSIYALAAQWLCAPRQALPWRAGYWFVAREGFRDKQSLAMADHDEGEVRTSAEWDELRPRIMARIVSLVHAARRGQFPMFNRDEQCTSRCDFHTVCRVNQTRSLEKQWQP